MMVDSGDKPASEKTPSLNAAIGKSEKFSELGPFSLLFDAADRSEAFFRLLSSPLWLARRIPRLFCSTRNC